MGTVYEAVQENLGRRVAVKVLDERLSYDREQLERFRREAEVVASLGHPNIVQVTDFQYPEDLGKQPFLVMELLRGESLASRIERDGAMTAERVAFVIAQVLSALVAAHRAGVVHRDIKPDNIFLLAEAAVPDTVKVLDFGIAKLTDAATVGPAQQKLTSTNAMLGTPAFMAPEQARGLTDVDARADIYAIGATMYQALTGRLPFEAASVPALLFKIVEKDPEPLRDLRPDLPADFVALVERAMAKERDTRFSTADEMRRALAPWSGLPASIPPPISATAATVASGKIVPHDPATPIVVHRTPPPSTKPATSVPPPVASSEPRGGPSALALISRVLIVGMISTAAVFIFLIWKKGDAPRRDREPASLPTSSATLAATASTTTTIASAAASPPALVASTSTVATTTSAPSTLATVAPKKKRYSGDTGWKSGHDFSGCMKCDAQTFSNDMGMRVKDTSACFAASQYTAPIHETPYYTMSVDDAGHLTMVHSEGGTPALDQCLFGVMQSVGLKGGPGTFKVGFQGECTKGWNAHCD